MDAVRWQAFRDMQQERRKDNASTHAWLLVLERHMLISAPLCTTVTLVSHPAEIHLKSSCNDVVTTKGLHMRWCLAQATVYYVPLFQLSGVFHC